MDEQSLQVLKTTSTEIPTDDWPSLYSKEREVPTSYIVGLLLMLGISGLILRSFVKTPLVLSAPRSFLLGAGFMQIETNTITRLALVFGCTWEVVSITILMILTMAFLANLLMQSSLKLPDTAVILFLVTSTLFPYFLPHLYPIASSNGKFLFPLLLNIPIFFSGLLFSSEIKKHPTLSTALAPNIFGAMCGGALEYLSMAFVLTSLSLIAAAIYIIAGIAPSGLRGNKGRYTDS